MAGSTITLSEDAQKIMASEAYADFMATEVEGQTRAERATSAGKTPSTVSASVKRIEAHIKDGTIPDPREGSALDGVSYSQTQRRVDRLDIAENMVEGAGLFVAEMDKLDGEEERVVKRMQQFTDQIEALAMRKDKLKSLAERVGFNWDEFDAAVASASPETEGAPETGLTDTTQTTPETAEAGS